MKCISFLSKLFFFFYLSSIQVFALEVIRDTELEQFTEEVISILLKSGDFSADELNIYFVKSDQINAFVTGGKNIFINTETIIKASNYGEYAAVLSHELAHIIGGHIFNTRLEISNLSDKALPIYLLGIIGIIAGSADSGLAGVMVGQASVNDGYAFYSRTQEASADQAAVNILCKSGISGRFLIDFLNKIEKKEVTNLSDKQNYRSTHPLTQNRITWINSALKQNNNCSFKLNQILENRFELLKAKLHGFTHSHTETEAVYNSSNDVGLYATAVSNYFIGNHSKSIANMEKLVAKYPSNPFYKELLGEIYFANNNFDKATEHHRTAINQLDEVNDLYFMMMGNYLLVYDNQKKSEEAVAFLKKSLRLNPKNAYAWYLLSRAYAQIGQISFANYATAERYFLTGERGLSYEFALKALKDIEENSPEWYRSTDLIEILKKEVSNKEQ